MARPDPCPLPRGRSRPTRLAAAAALSFSLGLPAAHAQDAAPTTVTITGRSSGNSAAVAGFGDVPLHRAPFSATVISTAQLADAGITGLAELTRLDAGTTDAYNAPGYWSLMAVRGFTLDPQFNYRRDGLPINAESVLALSNKRSIELLKGTSGLQAGTSAPGGLINLGVKRPAGRLRQASLTWAEENARGVTLDVGDGDTRLGWRVNAEYTHLQPKLNDSRGHRSLLAVAVDAEPVAGTLIEAEIEHSLQSQPSTPGFSVLGSRLPDANDIDPRLNLNNQAWTLPVVMQGRTGSVRLTQALPLDGKLVAHAMRQRLDSDDRIAFPFGCSAENDYTRYCSDGSFDLYDFRSEGERRTTDAFDLALSGNARIGGMRHQVSLGVLHSRFEARFGRQAYNWVGSATLDGRTRLPPDPALTDENTNRDERSTEWRLQDRVAIGARTQLWAGIRHSAIDRRSVRTDGSRAAAYRQSFATPWLAVTHAAGDAAQVYASWGQGVESTVTPARARYTNAGQALPALRSRGIEFGYKWHGRALDLNFAVFDIRRPEWADLGPCEAAGSCTRAADGESRHWGLEADAEWRAGAWAVRGSAMWLRARRQDSAVAALNGLRPTNVPDRSLKAQLAYNVPAVPGLAALAFVTHEGRRAVLPDNSLETPGWTRVDLALRHLQRAGGASLLWRIGVDNVGDRRAWKESPYQFSHAYLYPLAPRTVAASLQVTL